MEQRGWDHSELPKRDIPKREWWRKRVLPWVVDIGINPTSMASSGNFVTALIWFNDKTTGRGSVVAAGALQRHRAAQQKWSGGFSRRNFGNFGGFP